MHPHSTRIARVARRTFALPLGIALRRRHALAAVIVVAASLPATAQGKDEQWEITSKMEMPGMPMAMPAQVNRICVAQEREGRGLHSQAG